MLIQRFLAIPFVKVRFIHERIKFHTITTHIRLSKISQKLDDSFEVCIYIFIMIYCFVSIRFMIIITIKEF